MLTGGQRLQTILRGVAKKIESAKSVRVGFLEGGEYPDGTSIPQVAATNEFGGRIEVAARDQTIYRRTNKDGSFAKGGRFVKRKSSNFASTHSVGAYVIDIPSRPFFRNMIADKSPGWGAQLGAAVRANDYNAEKSLNAMGLLIKDQLQESIRSLKDPPNAPSTIKRKGFDSPLIDTGTMLNSVDYEVT